MRCDRFINRSGETGQVMGTFGVQRIALRGPGCISGTGRCEGVAGTGGRRCCEEVAGSGGRRHNHRDDVMGTGERHRCINDPCELCLKTPTIVPR